MESSTRFASVEGRFTADYMLHAAQRHHVQLSAMADQKANIIIGFSSVILSVGITQLNSPDILWAIPILVVFSGIALTFAIQAVTPRFQRREHPDKNSATNPLFFGHFTELSLEAYEAEMETILESDALVYQAMVKDLYQLGRLLKYRKYRYLALSYRFFWVGVVTALTALAGQLILRYAGFAV